MTQNRLSQETSPYLLQHADNPVHWHPWGPKALAEARSSGKPILLSIGYAACHWCHVMAHESFEDPETARWMNDLFVNIKVDREERPDIDQLYMAALHQLGEQGGWPLTMFLTPDGDPFWGGTYFPKTARYGRPGFVDVLKHIARIFREDPGKIEQNRAAITARLTPPAGEPGQLSPDIVPAIAGKLLEIFDPVNGGLNGAPKFPQAPILDLVWRAGLMTGETRFFETVEHTLSRIARGGIYDHLGGGFARYAVDDRWLVPHFEKMLYDNAQLIELMTTAWLRTGNPLFRARIEETVDWLTREMIAEGGALAASLDADSEGEEGRFYVWDKAEINGLLGDQAALFAEAYDVTDAGNFEGRTILNRLDDPFPLSEADETHLAEARTILFKAREPRVHPGRDDKILADWNGMIIAALAYAGRTFERPDWIALAETAYRFVTDSMTRDGRIAHAYRDGKMTWPGLSSDYAAMASAALALFEAAGDRLYLDDAISLANRLETWHVGEDGTYRLAASDATDVTIRMRSGVDEATANPNGIAATVLIRLYHQTGEERFLSRADRLLAAFASDAAQNPVGHASLLSALAVRTAGLQVVLIGEPDDLKGFLSIVNRVPDPNRSLIVQRPDEELPTGHPAHGKAQVDGRATAYICTGETCSLPITDRDAFATRLMPAGR